MHAAAWCWWQDLSESLFTSFTEAESLNCAQSSQIWLVWLTSCFRNFLSQPSEYWNLRQTNLPGTYVGLGGKSNSGVYAEVHFVRWSLIAPIQGTQQDLRRDWKTGTGVPCASIAHASYQSLQTSILCSPTHNTQFSIPSLQLKVLRDRLVLAKVPETATLVGSIWTSVFSLTQ